MRYTWILGKYLHSLKIYIVCVYFSVYSGILFHTLWNSLSEQLRQPDITFGQFNRSLKTFMFGYLGRDVFTLRALTRNFLTYLLTYTLPWVKLNFRSSIL